MKNGDLHWATSGTPCVNIGAKAVFEIGFEET